MSHYKPYPAYKDSGVEWLGKVPEHWSIRQLKSLARLTTGITPPTDNPDNYADEGFPWVRPEDLDELGRPTLASKFLSEGGKGHVRQVGEKSSLICCIGTIGKVGYADRAVSTNQQITSAEFHTNGRFFFYTLQASLQALDAAAVGNVIRILNTDRLGSIAYPQPSTIECSVIAAHLDRETARIDALVEKKTRFIELLREKRQALITHAVTKGLDPNVKMKDSGVEWLGEVPEHWETKRAAALFREVVRPGVADLPVLSISIHSGVSDDELSADERDRKVSLIEDREKYKRVCPGDLAYNMMRAWQGAFGAVMVDGLVSPAYVVAEPRSKICTEYVELMLRTPMAVEEMRRFSRGIADFRLRMYWEAFRDVVLLSPPYEEQVAIVGFAKQESLRIDGLVAKTERSIVLLKERRSALITAAVTGQIDLREAV